jgi:hypothetical protein
MFNKIKERVTNNEAYKTMQKKVESVSNEYTNRAMDAASRAVQKINDVSLTAVDDLSNKAGDALNNQVNNINSTLDKLNINQMVFNDGNATEINEQVEANNNQNIASKTTGGKKKKTKKGGCCGCSRKGGRARSRSKRRSKSKSKSKKYK